MRNTETCPGKILFALFALLGALSPDGLLARVGEWTTNGPDGAAVIALAAHPSNPSTVYVATFRRVYKSVDGGARWAPTGLSGYFDLLLPTSAPAVAYAILTDPYGFGAAFHRTSDGGESWVGRATPPGHFVLATVDSNDPMALYAVTTSGLFRTTNGGDAWEPLASPSVGGFGLAGIAVDPADSRVLYAARTAGDVPGVHRSSDRGATWNRTSLRDPTRQLLFDPTDSSRLFALTSTGLQVTSNRGESWRRLAQVPERSHLAIDTADSNRMYIITGGVFLHSSDGGETVTPVSARDFGGNVGTIATSGSGVVLAGSERGIYRSQDVGRAWAAANLGIREIFVHSLAIDPTDPAVVFAAGPRGIYESRDGGEAWNEPVAQSPDAEVVAIDPSDHSTLYAGGTGGVHKSTDGGQTWQRKSPPSGAISDYIAELLIDPNNSRRLFAAYGSIYRSLDGAEHWTPVLTPDDDYSSYYYPPTVSSIALAPSTNQTLYAGGDSFIYRSDDGGEQWSDLRAGIGTYALVVDSCDPRIVQSGLFGAVYRTLDGGATWTANYSVSQNTPYPNAVWALARDPRHSSTYFAGTAAGLFWTNDRGASWKRFEPALDEAVRSLALDSSGRFLYAGTERGVFQLERDFAACRNGPDRLCLLGAKYQVSLTARDPRTGTLITGRAIEEGDRFGYFSLPGLTADPSFPEVFVKMKDATGAPPPYGGHAWVFHSSLTDLDYTLTVLETDTGRIRTYDAADSESLTCGRADTSAFERDCAAEVSASRMPGTRLAPGSGADLSLLSGRFRATIQARDPRTGRIAVGAAIPRGDGFGYFSLPDFTGDPSFPEIFVKMVDATAQPGGYFWAFHTGLTDLDYTLTVTDVATGAVRTYSGGATDGTRLCGETDTTAFRNQ